jgi:hypothetical protein
MRCPRKLLCKKFAVKTKNPLGLLRQRAEECLISETLSTPQPARRMAVVMMAPSVVNQNHEWTE